jgi:hypothetical protein
MTDYSHQILDPATREMIRHLVKRIEKLEKPEKEVVNMHLSPAELHIELAFPRRKKAIGDE